MFVRTDFITNIINPIFMILYNYKHLLLFSNLNIFENNTCKKFNHKKNLMQVFLTQQIFNICLQGFFLKIDSE